MDLRLKSLLKGLPRAVLDRRDENLLFPLGYQHYRRQDFERGQPIRLRRQPPAVDRRELASALASANTAYGHPRAEELAQRLADPATRVVVSGQQPGLFGGPLYTLTKMVAAVRWVEALEASDESAVAVFWVATEDHDFSEASQVVVPGRREPAAFDLGPDPAPLVPLGMRTLGPGVDQVLGALGELGQGYDAWLATLARWYRPDARFGEAFCRLMVHLLGSRTPLLLDAMSPTLKALERPFLRRLVERRHEVEEALLGRDELVRESGHELQVTPQPGTSPLFLYRRERRRIRWDGPDRFGLRGTPAEASRDSEPVADLLRLIEDNPSVVSPGVLARPAIQDAVLGTSLQLLGPGEMAYMAQAAALYPVLEVEPPATTLRPQVMVLDARQQAQLESLGVSLGDLVGGSEALGSVVARQMGADFVGPVKLQVQEVLSSLEAPSLDLDPQLERPLAKTHRQVLQALDLFETKVTAAASRKDEVRRRRLEGLRSLCLPLGKLQERVISTFHFPARYGDGFLDALWDQLDLDPTRLQVIRPDAPGTHGA